MDSGIDRTWQTGNRSGKGIRLVEEILRSPDRKDVRLTVAARHPASVVSPGRIVAHTLVARRIIGTYLAPNRRLIRSVVLVFAKPL